MMIYGVFLLSLARSCRAVTFQLFVCYRRLPISGSLQWGPVPSCKDMGNLPNIPHQITVDSKKINKGSIQGSKDLQGLLG